MKTINKPFLSIMLPYINIKGCCLPGSTLDHSSLPPQFESRRGHI